MKDIELNKSVLIMQHSKPVNGFETFWFGPIQIIMIFFTLKYLYQAGEVSGHLYEF